MTHPLSAERVSQIFDDCVADDPESHTAVKVEGILHDAVFDRPKLADHHAEIGALLAELPKEFQETSKGGGGGWSFLNACTDRHGHQWTGFHLVMERLFLLGIATGQAQILVPRDMWDAFPGGMPYIGVFEHA